MEIGELQIGDKVAIEVGKISEKVSFTSEIIAILKDERILISEISHEQKSVGFSETGNTSFIHVGEKLHRWIHPSIRLVKYKNQLCHCVTLNGNGTLYNRRESFRMYIGEEYPMSYPTSLGILRKTVLIKDISTGGIAFIISDREPDLPINKKVRIHMVDGHYDMNLNVEIIRTDHLEEQHATLYGCRFLNPEAVVGRYIMQKQGQKIKEKRG